MLIATAILLLLLATAITAALIARSPVYRIFAYTIDHWAEDIHGVDDRPLR